jgi:phenylalanyl-tRNA synthetase beta chain
MRIPLEWLAEWIDLPERGVLCGRLEMSGFEDVVVLDTGPDLSTIRVGEVLERAPHPNADRLSLCRVSLGEDEPLEVVCGAPNVAAGQKVAVAVAGTRLPDGTKLKRSKIRGVASNGMILSSRELGLGDDHAGILVLDAAAPVGAPLPQVLAGGEAVLEVGITPNRGDAASVLGLAREVRALFGGAIRTPELSPPESGAPASDSVAVSIEARDECHRYVARVVRGVRIGPSPEWLKRRLEASGFRPVNNVVDVTNLVLLEFGQPLHAFDLRSLRGAQVRVRGAAAGEKLVTLDGEARELRPGDLVIADGERPVALAGVMGGADTEVGEDTRDVLIESAHFHPTTVRLTARHHGLRSEASYRFERGVDREGVRRAADRAARLMAELAGGSVAPGAVDAVGREPAHTREIRLEVARANRLLGTELAGPDVAGLLERVGIACRREGGDLLVARIPSHRNDLHLAEDLVEEVARIHGYDRIPTTQPVGELVPAAIPPGWALAEAVRDALVAAGLAETVSFPFLAPEELAGLGLEPGDPRGSPLRLANPFREEEPLLRTSLVPSLLRAARQNLSRQVERIRLFEVARVFIPTQPGELPREPLQAAALVTAPRDRALWQPEPAPPLFFEAKGIAERLMNALGYEPRWEARGGPPYLHPGAAAAIVIGSESVGSVGELHPEVANAFDVGVPCALVELDLDALLRTTPRGVAYREVSRFPQVRRDLAVVVGRERPAGELLAAIRDAAGRDCIDVELFDRYEGRGVPEGRVSLAFRLVFQRNDRTLTDSEVSSAADRVVRMLSRRFDGKLRHVVDR